MKKIENFVATAPKIKFGQLEYCLWTDDEGALYVQINRNLTETDSPGKHSKLLFRVSRYLNNKNTDNDSEEMRGIDPITLTEEVSKDNNDVAFIKAILKHLFP
jgi:hypothetical protein